MRCPIYFPLKNKGVIMAIAKQVIHNLLDTLPESQLMQVVDFMAFIKKRNELPGSDRDVETAGLSSMDFWDNAIDDEVWNNV